MTIADAARATRIYFANTHDCESWSVTHDTDPYFEQPAASEEEAQAACDRLNLLAVLEALREPSEGMLRASDRFAHTDETENIDWKGIARIQWRAMIDALIAEVREQGND